MERIFISPSKYIQGPNVLARASYYLKPLGDNCLLLADDFVWEICGKKLEAQLIQEGISVKWLSFSGESSHETIETLMLKAKELNSQFVIGLGGGKTLDTAKALSNRLNCPVAILPTVASTDAPTSAISVIYSESGVFQGYDFYQKNPDLVLVDTQVISQAPAHLLISGIADALATCVESSAVARKGGMTLAHGQQTLAIAEKCQDVLFRDGLQAVADNRQKKVSPAFEAVVEANTLLSGLGFESGGLAGAHAIHNGFSAITGPIHQLSHGQKVGYGTLTQLVLEEVDEAILQRFFKFYRELGLPTTLKEMGLADCDYQELLKIGQQATRESETIHYLKQPMTAEKVANALIKVDDYRHHFV